MPATIPEEDSHHSIRKQPENLLFYISLLLQKFGESRFYKVRINTQILANVRHFLGNVRHFVAERTPRNNMETIQLKKWPLIFRCLHGYIQFANIQAAWHFIF